MGWNNQRLRRQERKEMWHRLRDKLIIFSEWGRFITFLYILWIVKSGVTTGYPTIDVIIMISMGIASVSTLTFLLSKIIGDKE